MLPGITKTFFAEGRGESGNDAYTVLLLHFDSDYIDYSLGATGPVRTFVRGSGAIRESSGGKFGGGRLRVGDVDTSRISTTQSVDFDFGAGDFTIDYWVLRNSDGTCEHISKRSDSGYGPWVIQYSGGFLYFYASVSGTAWDISAWPIATISLGVWTHIALVRNGTTLKSYVNGVLYATMTSSISLQAASNRLNIGGLGVAGCSSPNYFDEIRISKGIARWTANFTPRTSAYGPNPNRDVLLLMHFDDANGTPFGSFIDSSPFSRGPFQANGSPYIVNPGGNLGSGVVVFPNDAGRHYFVPMQSIDFDFMGDDFTIEWWEYRVGDLVNDARPSFLRENDAVVYQSFLIGWNEGGTLKFYWSHDGANWGAGAPLVLGATTSAWTHYAVVRKGGTFYGFRNGILQDTKAVTGALMPGVANQYLSVGYWNYGPGYLFVGYMDEIRISKIARWTADFPVPTIPYGYDPVLYSVVLYITAEGSITDISAWQRPINNQGVAIDNNTMRFIPNTYLTVSNTNELQIRNKDFTIEAWLMARSIPGGNQRFYVHSSSTTDNNNGIFLGYHADASFDARINIGGATPIVLNTGPGAFALWQWHHYAFVRYGNKWSLFIDGVERVNQTTALTVPDFGLAPHIGVIPGGSEWMSGFIDDFKFTNGIALYTNNFTPTAPPAIPENVKAATYFVLSAPGTVNVHQTFTVYIQAYNATGVAVNYNGTIRITSNDPNATLPGDIPYNSLYGQGAFNVTLRNYGNPYYIYATDITTTGISGNSNGINVPSPVWRETYISAVGYGEMYVPGGWTTTNIIECISGGAAGPDGNYIYNGNQGGGGGGYARSDNVGWGPGSYLGYVVGGGGAPPSGYGGDTWFGDPNICRSQGGQGPNAGGVYAAYTAAYAGGYAGPYTLCGSGGGGAGGMYGTGANGGYGSNARYSAGGGGGHGGGAGGGNADDGNYVAGYGGNSYAWGGGGAGGYWFGSQVGGDGVYGGGGGGGTSDPSGNPYRGGHGGNGPEWGTNLGAGGGGGGCAVGSPGYYGGNGGAWGGGAGGAGILGSSGWGHQGLIRLRWYGP